MAMMEITVVPLGTASPSLSDYVAEAIRLLEQAGVEYRLCPMGTTIVGEVDDLLQLARRMHEQPFLQGALRVATTIKIDDRRDKPLTMEGKIRAVRDKLHQ
ncbi:MAG: MTH1187 family thiamine-binding protein [Chloroflexia bacterium]|nr:MTH1187 family thiamine-binding protein [Chloroflexia bacterium]